MEASLEKNKARILLEDALLLVEQNFCFLSAGQFFGKLAKSNRFDDDLTSISLKCDEVNTYHFDKELIKVVLEDAYSSKDSSNVSMFEYFIAFNSFRGICMAMVEALRLDSGFRQFLEERLGNRFEDLFDILSFIRNVLSHNIHAEIALSTKDYEGTLKRIRRMKRDANINFLFLYDDTLPEISSPHLSYGFTCRVDFDSLKEEMPFLEIISLWELLMISEMSYNLVQIYRLIYQDDEGIF